MKISALFTCSLLPFCLNAHLNELYEEAKPLAKSELHLHIGGSWPLNYLEKIAEPDQFLDLCHMLKKIQNREASYHEAFRAFTLVEKIVDSEEKVEKGVVALCEDLIQDNVVYAEFRTGIKDLGSGLEEYLQAVLKGIQKGTKDSSLQVGLVLSLRRNSSSFIAAETLRLTLKYRDQGIVGLDLSGDSTLGEGENIFPVFLKAKEQNFPITLHIGESPKEKAEQQILELTTLHPERIGHGVHLCDEAKQWIKDKQIPVELCLTSAIQAAMILNENEHPALQLLMNGHPVAICTDDPLIFNTNLSTEYARVASVTGLSVEELHRAQDMLLQHRFSKIGLTIESP